MRAWTHGGGAHRQRVSTTFWLWKTLTNLSCALDGIPTSGHGVHWISRLTLYQLSHHVPNAALVKVGLYSLTRVLKSHRSKWAVGCTNMIEQTPYNVEKTPPQKTIISIKWPLGDVFSIYLVIFPATLLPFSRRGSHRYVVQLVNVSINQYFILTSVHTKVMLDKQTI